MSTSKMHDDLVKELEHHLSYFAVCPCCGNKRLHYTSIPRARMTFVDISCSDCTFIGSCKIWK